jgi:hypothetical protein
MYLLYRYTMNARLRFGQPLKDRQAVLDDLRRQFAGLNDLRDTRQVTIIGAAEPCQDDLKLRGTQATSLCLQSLQAVGISQTQPGQLCLQLVQGQPGVDQCAQEHIPRYARIAITVGDLH